MNKNAFLQNTARTAMGERGGENSGKGQEGGQSESQKGAHGDTCQVGMWRRVAQMTRFHPN